MEIVITAESDATLDLWRRELADDLPVELWRAEPRDVPADAVAVSGVFAFGRYGGRPKQGVAQILRNHRNDGYPALVVVPPSRPATFGPDGTPIVLPEYADVSPAYFGVSRALAALTTWNAEGGEPHVHVLLFPLTLLGMDSADDASTPRSVGAAVRDVLGLGANRGKGEQA